MKRISIQSLSKRINIKSGIFLFICVLFAFQSCTSTKESPSQNFILSGTVTSADSRQGIKGIKVSMINPSLLYASDSFYGTEGWDYVITSYDGKFSFNVWHERPYGRVFFEDIDSTANGFYQSKSVEIGITSQDEIEVNIKLDKVE